MTEYRFLEMVEELTLIFGGAGLEDKVRDRYHRALLDISNEDVPSVIDQCVRDWSRFPTAAQIRKSAERAGVTFEGNRPKGTADDSDSLPPFGSPEWAEGTARFAFLFTLLRAGPAGREVARVLGKTERGIREAYVVEIAQGGNTGRAAAREAIRAFRGNRQEAA